MSEPQQPYPEAPPPAGIDTPPGVSTPIVPKYKYGDNPFEPSSRDSNLLWRLGPPWSGREDRGWVPTPVYEDSKKAGNMGSPINLKANFFVLKTTAQWRVYEYCVDFSPEEENIGIRKKLLKMHASKIGASLFDGTVLHTVKRFDPDPLELYSIRETDGKRITMSIKWTCDVSSGDDLSAQIFKVIIRKCFQEENMQLMGRDYFDPLSQIAIPEYGLQMWPGYKLTMTQYEDYLLMVLELTPKVLRKDTVLEMLEVYATLKGNDYKKIFSEDIVGQIVWTDYNKKSYRIDDVSWEDTPLSEFKIKDKTISYRDYYRKRYNILIRHAHQPLLISRSHPRKVRLGMPELVYLVPELCRQTGLTDEMSSDSKLKRVLDANTKNGNDTRFHKVLELVQRMTKSCEVSRGRQLPVEKIHMDMHVRFRAGDTSDGWTRAMRSKPLCQIANMPSWVVITPESLRRETQEFIEMLMKTAASVGRVMPKPKFYFLTDDDAIDYYNVCEEAIASKEQLGLVVCVLARRCMERYHAIKNKCLVDRGVPTQVITARTMARNSVRTIAAKLTIQINCKLGAIPWGVDMPLRNTLVIGYAVARDYQTTDKSYGALVASTNYCMSSFLSVVSAHTSGDELSVNMACHVVTALRRYQKLNGDDLPRRILIYRDTVNGEQNPYVHRHELTEIKTRLAEIYGELRCGLAFIIVSRHVDMPRFMDRCRNGQFPPGGTVIDDVFIKQEGYDFYLVSQNGRAGSVLPTSYSVIEDTTGIYPDRMQWLTYKFTHMYFNCSAPIGVPALCQYAHKLANLVANTLHAEPNLNLCDTLYYL